MSDPFSGLPPLDRGAALLAPATDGAMVSPSDALALPCVTRGIWVGGAGDLAVVMMGGQAIVFSAVPSGTFLPIRVLRVLAAGTTATSLVAVW